MDSNHSIEMSIVAFAAVNVPVSVSSILLNIIFVFCMKIPQQGAESIKQPLKALLGSLVGCNIAAHASIFVLVVMALNNFFESLVVRWCITSIAIYTMMISINSSHCLNIFCCFQIIPLQHWYFIWFKRNIRVFIYCALIINTTVCFLGMSVNVTFVFAIDGHFSNWNALYSTFEVALYITLSLFALSFCVMLASSCVTVIFLWRHLKYMEKSSGSSPHRQRKIRLIIINIGVQALLHITCSALVVIDVIIFLISIYYFDMEHYMLCTVISLYCFGTTINLGVTQSVFRQRAVQIWRKWFRPHSRLSAITTAQTSFV